MGVCFSKKKEPAAAAAPAPPPSPPKTDPSKKKKKSNTIAAVAHKEETKKEVKSSPQQAAAAAESSAAAAAPVEKKPVFVITQNTKKTASNSATSSEEEKKKEKQKKGDITEISNVFVGLPRSEEARAITAVRTSNCTKEEVDAILIQCGRLSRSSSGKASNDTGGGGHGHRKYSGSKRSYDFDNEKGVKDDQEEVWDQKQLSRPSPRRRTPSRERSGSRERGSQRRVSRSPGRRSDGPAAAASSSSSGYDKPKQQPAKMVSVPAREKGVSTSAAANVENAGAKRFSANRRNASPRSRSPANTTTRVSNENAAVHQPQSLSRSSSKKAEQSPCRRDPMTEIDDNSLRGSSNTNKAQKSREGDEGVRKATQIQQKNGSMNNNTSTISKCVRGQLMSCRAEKNQPETEIVEEAKDAKGASKVSEIETLNHRQVTRTRSSRRSSRDLDHILGLNSDTNNPNAANYTSLLLEDIQNYHQQNAGFSLPACVSKACSILEALADLNSSSTDQSNNDNGLFGRRGLTPKEPFVESEIAVKDDLMEPSLHKYISVRDLGAGGETEPQESAGSNSFVGQPWYSAWELNSVDSTDRHWTAQSNHGEEVEESSLPEVVARNCDAGAGTRLRSGGSSSSSHPSATGSSNKKRDEDHHRQLHRGGSGVSGLSMNGKGGGRSYSLPVAAAATS